MRYNKLKQKQKIFSAAVVVAACLSFAISFSSYSLFDAKPAENANMRPESFADIVEKIVPAVVNISTMQKASIGEEQAPPNIEDFFRNPFKFFERDFDGMKGGGAGARPKELSSGSGFIIDDVGHIVTNLHVIMNADAVKVKLSGSHHEYIAEVIGIDQKTDLALLKIETKEKLPYLKFGDSEKTRAGDWTIAVGNPFGLGGTVTAGIISAKSRSISLAYDGFIQTDTSINPGNSGGPLLNTKGEVIGVNNMILTPGRGNVGIGFAIPSRTVEYIISKLKADGKVTRSWLGIKIQMLSLEVANSLGLDVDKEGVAITSLVKDGPADKAGFLPGDVITKFNGKVINNDNVIKVIAETEINKQVEVEVLRNGKRILIEMVTEPSQEEEILASKSNSEVESNDSSSIYFGMEVVDLTEEQRLKYKIDEDVREGVIVTNVKRGSEASFAGIVPGVVIMKVNNQSIGSLKQFIKAIEDAKNDSKKSLLLLLNYKGDSQFVVLREDK